MNADYNYTCNEYPVYFWCYVLPMLLIWGFVIPLLPIYFIKRNKHRLNEVTCLLKYGFLYQEYKPELYFWEAYKVIIRITIVFIIEFWKDYYVFSRIVIFYILFFYNNYIEKVRPYKDS